MGRVRNEVYIHVVWATWNREPLLTAVLRPRVLAAIADECRELGAEVMALNAMAEHVHLLVRLPTTVTVAKLVQQVKGSSSHLAGPEVAGVEWFKWQGYYAVFSVASPDVPSVCRYIEHQAEHHASELVLDWELPPEPRPSTPVP